MKQERQTTLHKDNEQNTSH